MRQLCSKHQREDFLSTFDLDSTFNPCEDFSLTTKEMADNDVVCLGGDSADTLSSLEINQLLDSGVLDPGQPA